MRHLILIVIALVACLDGKPEPHRNLACVTAELLGLDNPRYEPLVTGWGFTPDTCLVQAATLQGDKRIPTRVVWCATGVGEPVCKPIFGPPERK